MALARNTPAFRATGRGPWLASFARSSPVFVHLPSRRSRRELLVGFFKVAVFLLLAAGAAGLTAWGGQAAFQRVGWYPLVVTCAAPVAVLFAVVLVNWLTYFSSQRQRLRSLAFAWGTLVGIASTLLVNPEGAWAGGTTSGLSAETMITAAVVQAALTAIIVVRLRLENRRLGIDIRSWDSLADVVACPGLAAVGFASVVQAGALVRFIFSGVPGAAPSRFLVDLVLFRAILAPFAHAFFTSIAAVGIGWALRRSGYDLYHYLLAASQCALAYLVAVAGHALWISYPADFSYPIGALVIIVVVVVIAWRIHEGSRRSTSALRDICNTHPSPDYWIPDYWIPDYWIDWLNNGFRRWVWRMSVHRKFGRDAALKVSEYQKAVRALVRLNRKYSSRRWDKRALARRDNAEARIQDAYNSMPPSPPVI